MAEKHEKGVKRFGVRYGRTTKKKLGKLEAQQKRKYKCPYCAYEKVHRQSAGIWHCSKCDATFASKAYTVSKAPVVRTEQSREI